MIYSVTLWRQRCFMDSQMGIFILHNNNITPTYPCDSCTSHTHVSYYRRHIHKWDMCWFTINGSCNDSKTWITRQSEMANTSPATCQCLATFTPLNSKMLIFFSWRHFSARSSCYIINWYGYPRGSHEKYFKEIVTPVLRYAIEMLNVAHVKNYVKWRPIVTKFGTLLDNMSRTGLYDCHIFFIFIDNFMRISNFGMGVLHVKVKYWRIFCDVISLLALVFILSSNRVSKEVSRKKNEIFLLLCFCDMTVLSKSKIPSLWPWPLTYEGQFILVNWVQPYKYPV